jgi:hypothetical protein
MSEIIAQDPVDVNVRPLVVVQKVWVQVSADYDATERTRTIAVTPDTTVGEVMRWAAAGNVLGRGDVVLTEQDHAA